MTLADSSPMVTHDPKAAKAASLFRYLDNGLLLPLEGLAG